MRDKLATKLAAPDLYDESRKSERLVWQAKFVEVQTGLDRAETLWVRAQEKLETSRG